MNEAAQCYDMYFTAVMQTLSQKLCTPNDPRVAVKEYQSVLIEVADQVAHNMVVQRYKRLAKSTEENDGIDYRFSR